MSVEEQIIVRVFISALFWHKKGVYFSQHCYCHSMLTPRAWLYSTKSSDSLWTETALSTPAFFSSLVWDWGLGSTSMCCAESVLLGIFGLQSSTKNSLFTDLISSAGCLHVILDFCLDVLTRLILQVEVQPIWFTAVGSSDALLD